MLKETWPKTYLPQTYTSTSIIHGYCVVIFDMIEFLNDQLFQLSAYMTCFNFRSVFSSLRYIWIVPGLQCYQDLTVNWTSFRTAMSVCLMSNVCLMSFLIHGWILPAWQVVHLRLKLQHRLVLCFKVSGLFGHWKCFPPPEKALPATESRILWYLFAHKKCTFQCGKKKTWNFTTKHSFKYIFQ